MGFGEVPQGKYHARQGCSNRKRSRGGVRQDVEADRQHEHVGPKDLGRHLRWQRSWLPVVKGLGPHHLEECCRQRSAGELEQDVQRGVAEAQAARLDAECNGRVEAAARDGPRPVRACHDHEANRKTVELVLACVSLGAGGVQDHEAEHERVEQLARARLPPRELADGAEGEAGPEQQVVEEAREHTCRDLHERVSCHVLPGQVPGDAQRHGDRGIEVGPRDRRQGVDGNHQGAGDRYSGPHALLAEDVAAHGEHENEGSDELREVRPDVCGHSEGKLAQVLQ
mmetsp:Transcript_36352/g.94928  ORF Transcript_36352/g.94928 Transcript_36352/m.94928 type:complete len:283 (-) Transcript_36352:40-888(-)